LSNQNGVGKRQMNLRSRAIIGLSLLAMAALCTCALAQENTTEYWTMVGSDLAMNESNYQGALDAFEKAIQIDPENMGAWDRKALIHYVLSKQAYLRVLSLSEKRLENNPQDARAWRSHAAALQSLDRIEESNQSLEKAVEIYDQETRENPGNVTAWFYKAEVSVNQTDALAAYEKVIELNGSMKIAAMITKGNILLNLGKSDEAIATIDKAIQLDPKNPQAWTEKALASYVLGKHNESLAAYEKVIELEPEFAPAWIWKGKGDALKTLGRQSEADAAYARAEELDIDSSAPVQENAAQDWFESPRNESLNDSLHVYDQALVQNPKNADAWLGKADVLFALCGVLRQPEKLNESLQAYDKAIGLIPVNSTQELAKAWSRKAFALANLADLRGHDENLYDEAIKAYDRAIELDPENADAEIGKSAVLATRLNRTDEALAGSNRAVELSSDEPSPKIKALEISVLSLLKSGKYDEANRTCDRILEISLQNSSDTSFAWQSKGNAQQGMKRYAEAIGYYDKALVSYPEDKGKLLTSGIWQDKGDALEAMGRHEEAIDAYEKDINAYPYDAPAWHKKGEILKGLGQDFEAQMSFHLAELLGYDSQSNDFMRGD